jgi:hypothetical protein
MLQRIINISVSMLLLMAIVGISVNKHFCSGELKEISLFKLPKSCCGEGCKTCHNESKVIKVTDDFVSSSFQIEPAKVLLLNLVMFHAQELRQLNTSFSANQRMFYPPPIAFLNNSSPSFLQNFRC